MSECTSCGNALGIRVRRGFCGACYDRWLYAGKPESGPSPVRAHDLDGHTEDCAELTEAGLSVPEIAARMGASERSVYRWRRRDRELCLSTL